MKRNSYVSEWVEKAEGDFETVRDLSKKNTKRQRYIIAFHCQQCIEKYLKAMLTYHKIEFPKQHDLEQLLVLLLEKEPLLLPIRRSLGKLTPFAVNFRYPGEDIAPKEVRQAINITEQLRVVLRECLGFKKK